VHNAYQPTLKGFSNAFVFKLNASGSQAEWSTYPHGSRFDGAFDVAIDRRHNVYVTGNTQSTDFPPVRPFQSTNMARYRTDLFDIPRGGSLINIPFRLAVSREEEVAVIVFTSSTDFPLQNPLQESYAGGNFDAFITRFSRGGDQLQFSTYWVVPATNLVTRSLPDAMAPSGSEAAHRPQTFRWQSLFRPTMAAARGG